MIRSKDFEEMVGEDLSGVTFVRDYLQLQFNPPPLLNAYTPVTVRAAGRIAVFGEPDFANLLVAQISKFVRSVEYREGQSLAIIFDDHSTISISLLPEHYSGPEAVNLFKKSKEMIVI
jgi:hypothetical protein